MLEPPTNSQVLPTVTKGVILPRRCCCEWECGGGMDIREVQSHIRHNVFPTVSFTQLIHTGHSSHDTRKRRTGSPASCPNSQQQGPGCGVKLKERTHAHHIQRSLQAPYKLHSKRSFYYLLKPKITPRLNCSSGQRPRYPTSTMRLREADTHSKDHTSCGQRTPASFPSREVEGRYTHTKDTTQTMHPPHPPPASLLDRLIGTCMC